MPRATSTRSESESERVSSKKQKKREESPADDPMDEDEKDEIEEDGDEEEEYEIERILESSTDIFPNKEVGYFVKWKNYPESENSWVRESDAPNADEVISKFLDEKRSRDKAKKTAAKRRKSAELAKQEPKKRGRISVKSKVESDEEEPERSPVQPIAKKQKKEKTTTSTKKKSEPTPEQVPEDDVDPTGFTAMDKYMHLDEWENLIDKIDTIERDEKGNLFIYGTLTTKDHFRLPSETANDKFPKKIIKFYEGNLRWRASEDGA